MTSQSKALAAKLEVIEAIEKDNAKKPTMPMDTYLYEAHCLYKWCVQDKIELTSVGLNWDLVEDLPIRGNAASEAQANWHNVRLAREEAQKEWKLLSPSGYELRHELLHFMRFAYRKKTDLQSRINSVAKGTGDADMIQGLNDLAVIGKENMEPLAVIGFDSAKLEEAANKSIEMREISAQAKVNKARGSDIKLIRDKSYTYLKEAVDAVRECGQFVFWKDEERKAGYASDYLRKNRKSAAKRKNEKYQPQATEY